MYMIFKETYDGCEDRVHLHHYEYLSNHQDRNAFSNAGLWASVEEAAVNMFLSGSLERRRFDMFADLQEATNILNVFQNQLIEEYRETLPEAREEINFYVVRINTRDVVKVVPNEFVEISARTENANWEDIPYDGV